MVNLYGEATCGIEIQAQGQTLLLHWRGSQSYGEFHTTWNKNKASRGKMRMFGPHKDSDYIPVSHQFREAVLAFCDGFVIRKMSLLPLYYGACHLAKVKMCGRRALPTILPHVFSWFPLPSLSRLLRLTVFVLMFTFASLTPSSSSSLLLSPPFSYPPSQFLTLFLTPSYSFPPSLPSSIPPSLPLSLSNHQCGSKKD